MNRVCDHAAEDAVGVHGLEGEPMSPGRQTGAVKDHDPLKPAEATPITTPSSNTATSESIDGAARPGSPSCRY